MISSYPLHLRPGKSKSSRSGPQDVKIAGSWARQPVSTAARATCEPGHRSVPVNWGWRRPTARAGRPAGAAPPSGAPPARAAAPSRSRTRQRRPLLGLRSPTRTGVARPARARTCPAFLWPESADPARRRRHVAVACPCAAAPAPRPGARHRRATHPSLIGTLARERRAAHGVGAQPATGLEVGERKPRLPGGRGGPFSKASSRARLLSLHWVWGVGGGASLPGGGWLPCSCS